MKIALIGHSGSGKTSTAGHFAGTLVEYNMDHNLDTGTCWEADAIKECILKMPSQVVAVSVHRDALIKIARCKSIGDLRYHSSIYYIYTRVEINALEKRLRAKGDRKESSIREILNEYKAMDTVFSEIADKTIDSSCLSLGEVARQIRLLLEKPALMPATDGR